MNENCDNNEPRNRTKYAYDTAGHLASMSSSNTNGVSLQYTYDTLNRLSTVVDSNLSSGHNTTTYAYDSANNVYTVTYPNGIEMVYQYDNLNRLTGLNSSQLGPYTYGLDGAGKITSALEPNNRAIQWSYDGINRLINEAITSAPSGKNGTVSYTLDPVGNRTSVTSGISGLSPVSGSFNQDDELTPLESYDSDGNVTATGGKTFTYDSQNQLTTMGSTVSLIYDGDGNRVAKSVNGTVTRYLVDDLNPTGYPQVVEELNSSGVVQRQYSYGLQRISEKQLISGTWTPSFYAYDGMGTVRQLTNISGTVTDTYDYDAFGNKINSTGTTPNNMLYRGEELDPDLGLYYLRARYMNPLTGRFLSRDPEDGDPTDPKTLHKYLYTGGDPVNGWDPTGREEAVSYSLFGARDIALTFAKAAVVSGVVDCLLEFSLSKFDGAIEAAWNGGSISQVGPCVWIFTNLQKALPQPQAPAQPVAGTKLSPWTPQCDELKATVDAAKTVANSLGKCTNGMSPWQLQVRYDAWVGLGAARAQYNMVCWHGGDEGHQEADANAWSAAGKCALLKTAF